MFSVSFNCDGVDQDTVEHGGTVSSPAELEDVGPFLDSAAVRYCIFNDIFNIFPYVYSRFAVYVCIITFSVYINIDEGIYPLHLY